MKPLSLKRDPDYQNWSRITSILIVGVNAVFDIFREETIFYFSVLYLEISGKREDTQLLISISR